MASSKSAVGKLIAVIAVFVVVLALLVFYVVKTVKGDEVESSDSATAAATVEDVNNVMSVADKGKIGELISTFESNVGTYGIEPDTLLNKDKLKAYVAKEPREKVYPNSDYSDLPTAMNKLFDIIDISKDIGSYAPNGFYDIPKYVKTDFSNYTIPDESLVNAGRRWVVVNIPIKVDAMFLDYYTNSPSTYLTKVSLEDTVAVSFMDMPDDGWRIYSVTDRTHSLLSDDVSKFGMVNGEFVVGDQSTIVSLTRSEVDSSGNIGEPVNLKQ